MDIHRYESQHQEGRKDLFCHVITVYTNITQQELITDFDSAKFACSIFIGLHTVKIR